MTQHEIKLPPLPEPDHFAYHDFGQGIWIEGGPTGTPFYSEQQVQELMREAVQAYARAAVEADRAPLLARIAELEAKLAEAQKDAERYRWLLDFGTPELWHRCAEKSSYDEVEAAIDAAMEAKP